MSKKCNKQIRFWRSLSESGLVCIKETIFCGHLCGLTIMFHPEDVPKSIQTTVPHSYN